MEKGENGTRHLQFTIWFRTKARLSVFKGVPVHAIPVTVDNGADAYVTKAETRIDGPWEFGVKPVKRNDKADWDLVRKQALAGELDKIPADIFIKHYSNL